MSPSDNVVGMVEVAVVSLVFDAFGGGTRAIGTCTGRYGSHGVESKMVESESIRLAGSSCP